MNHFSSFLSRHRVAILVLLFFLSGGCSLLYQTVWLRMAFAHFGVITPVISVVISVFMLGLALGSWIAAGLASRIQKKTGLSSIGIYGGAELIVGLGAFMVPKCYDLSSAALLNAGQTDSFAYLFLSALYLAACIFPWTVAMGMTTPLALKFMQEFPEDKKEGNFGLLYASNVAGAMCGVIATLALIEVRGFSQTLQVAMGVNFGIFALCSLWAAGKGKSLAVDDDVEQKTEGTPSAGVKSGLLNTVLFLTGFVSMAMELVWTRAFTPVLGTVVYSFACLLVVYLLSTCFGSLMYKLHLRRHYTIGKSTLLSLISLTALLPILITDPRLALGATPPLAVSTVLLSIVPFCAALGYLTPSLIDELSGGDAKRAGNLYALNIVGGIIGPLIAGYLLLPSISVVWSMILLALPLFAVAFMLFKADQNKQRIAFAVLAVLALPLSLSCQSWEERNAYLSDHTMINRDYAATTIAWGEGMGKNLAVNGWKVTGLGNTTKVMAHVPLALYQGKPSNALSICFGMGVTFRSILSWGINTKAVELVPGVKKAFSFYFPDKENTSKIIVDDGRRFLQRTDEKFDLIAVDPPPPAEAAGTSLLYSKEFYALAKQRLSKGGILHQMYPDWTEKNILYAVTRSITDSFKYVRVFRTDPVGIGFHYFASDEPIQQLDAEQIYQRMPESARADLCEWKKGGGTDCREELRSFLKGEIDIKKYLLTDDPSKVITDDHPYNEYFILRRTQKTEFLDPKTDPF